MQSYLYHITDVGAADGPGVDSTLRIEQQYANMGVNSRVISAGHSPLHVAFAACARLAPAAAVNASQFSSQPLPQLPMALNSAPRNSAESHTAGQEKNIFRITGANVPTMVVYGLEVVRWVVEFYGREGLQVQKVLSIGDVIPDTSSGSQFRSAEHLPIAHVLEMRGELLSNAVIEDLSLSELDSAMDSSNSAWVAPNDEYQNSRLIVLQTVFDHVLAKDTIQVQGLVDAPIKVQQSLTEVVPGQLSIWPSSNYFPNPNIRVLNVGTRWAPGTTDISDSTASQLSQKMSGQVGQNYVING
jgi:hypothetical protein